MQIDNVSLQFAYENFETRLQEVKNYVIFIRELADITSPSIVNEYHINSNGYVDHPTFPSYPIDRDLQKTLRASTYLLLYNLMESTMSESIDAIHETIKHEDRNLLELSEKLHKVILQSFSKGLTNEKVSEFSRSNSDIRDRLFDLGYDKKKLFSGNIDCGIISQYCKKYGINLSPYKVNNQPLLWNKEKIERIRRKRNSLAHGSESFAQCGQNMAVDTIDDDLKSVEAVLMGVFNGLNNFLTHQKYLRASQ